MSASIYRDITITGGRTHLGNTINHGPSSDQTILKTILESLRYYGMNDRQQMLTEAEEGTFEWALERDEVCIGPRWRGREKTIPVLFKAWLNGGDGDLFCVTGKAGSGKSTFMKFLSTHPKLENASKTWLGTKRLLRADHFFWIPGTPLQKSFAGPLRHLLYQCLSALTESSLDVDIRLAKDICDSRWSLLNKCAVWSQRELKAMLSRLGSSSSNVKLLLVIDGLDECEPQDRLDQLAREVVWISELPNVKICVSCRPWPALIKHLAAGATLCIDQLTYDDIDACIRNRLIRAEMESGTRLGFKDKTKPAETLIKFIIDTAAGVFLWVELVIKGLVGETRKCTSIERLVWVLETFPPNLDAYFQHLIYDRIPTCGAGTTDTASVLKLAMLLHSDKTEPSRPPDHEGQLHSLFGSSVYPKSVVNFWLLRKGYLRQVMSWVDLRPAMYASTDVSRMIKETSRFLTEACRDLLVVNEHHEREGGIGTLGANVTFLHRSVFDFLNSDKISRDIEQKAPSHFHDDSFLVELTRLRFIYLLGDTGIECRRLEQMLSVASELFVPGANDSFLATCHGLSAAHILHSRNCIGLRHNTLRCLTGDSRLQSQGIRDEFGVRPIPGRSEYVLAQVTLWPYCAVEHIRLDVAFNTTHSTLSTVLSFATTHEVSELCITLFETLVYNGWNICKAIARLNHKSTKRCNGSMWERWLARAKYESEKLYETPKLRGRFNSRVFKVASLMIQHGADSDCTPCIKDHSSEGGCIRTTIPSLLQSITGCDFQGFPAKHPLHVTCHVTPRIQRLRALRVPFSAESKCVQQNAHMPKFDLWLNALLEISQDCDSGGNCTACSKHIRWVRHNEYSLTLWCMDCEKSTLLCQECFSSPSHWDLTSFIDYKAIVSGDTLRLCGHTVIQLMNSGSGYHLQTPEFATTWKSRAIAVAKEWLVKNKTLIEDDVDRSEDEVKPILTRFLQSIDIPEEVTQ